MVLLSIHPLFTRNSSIFQLHNAFPHHSVRIIWEEITDYGSDDLYRVGYGYLDGPLGHQGLGGHDDLKIGAIVALNEVGDIRGNISQVVIDRGIPRPGPGRFIDEMGAIIEIAKVHDAADKQEQDRQHHGEFHRAGPLGTPQERMLFPLPPPHDSSPCFSARQVQVIQPGLRAPDRGWPSEPLSMTMKKPQPSLSIIRVCLN